MSSAIKLYEHNQKAYDALLDMLGECDRACVIKPTGTGKFVIFAKMVQDNPDKRFLLLGTNDYMFNDQMANLAEIAPGFTPRSFSLLGAKRLGRAGCFLVDLGCRALLSGCGRQRRVWKSFRQRASFQQRKIPTEISTNSLLNLSIRR